MDGAQAIPITSLRTGGKAMGFARAQPILRRPYCRFLSVAAAAGVGLGAVAAAAAGAGLGASAGALLLPLLAPNNSRVGFLSRLFTARLMSPRVLRPSDISSPERLSKSSASSRIDFTA